MLQEYLWNLKLFRTDLKIVYSKIDHEKIPWSAGEVIYTCGRTVCNFFSVNIDCRFFDYKK